VLPDELGRLGLPFDPTYFKDLDHLGVGHEVPKAFLIPVENHPHPVIVVRIAKNLRTLTPVLPSLFSALGRERVPPAVKILDLRSRQNQLGPPSLSCHPNAVGMA
jgi:hypothetical protein